MYRSIEPTTRGSCQGTLIYAFGSMFVLAESPDLMEGR